mgnify:CR=1 FL=1
MRQTVTHTDRAVQALFDQKEEADDMGEEVGEMDLKLVKLMLVRGADPNARDAEMQTPLHIAIMGGLHDVAALLCEADADPSLGCKTFGKDNTALHQATLDSVALHGRASRSC